MEVQEGGRAFFGLRSYNFRMLGTKKLSWRFTIRGIMAVTAGFALSAFLMRLGNQPGDDSMLASRLVLASVFVLSGTLGSFAGYVLFQSDEAGAYGFLAGSFLLSPILTLVSGQLWRLAASW